MNASYKYSSQLLESYSLLGTLKSYIFFVRIVSVCNKKL